MPKNIVVCCDGTGNEFGDSNSNVVKLASTLVIDEHQVSYYHPGVGTMGAPNARNWVEKKWDVIRGLAFGYGVTFCIADAYHYLIQTYEPGDQIYLFGLSVVLTQPALSADFWTCMGCSIRAMKG